MRICSFKQNRKSSRFILVSTLFLLLLFTAPPSAFAQSKESIAALKQMGKAFASIAEKTSPAVVGLRAEKTFTHPYTESPFGNQFDPFSDDLFDFFFRRSPRGRQPAPQRKYQQTAQGSGFIISADGYILTNNHLVGEAEKVKVELADEREFTAKIIGADPESDVAVIKIDANDLPYLELADSDALEVGEWVLAIGNPLGLAHTVTAGIVSAKGRSGFHLATYENFIQTDAAINFGNSGGPLINLDGEVVGINTAIIGSGGNIGIGFAIPINMAKHVYKQLRESGTVARGFLGVDIQDLTPALAKAFGMENAKGVLIPDVHKDSPAEKAGLKPNDVIVELEGKPVESAKTLQTRIAMIKPDTRVKIVVMRDGKRRTLTVKLAKRPPISEIQGAGSDAMEDLGFAVRNLTAELAERYGYEGQSGVIVSRVDPGSQAERVGIVIGALIKEVNRVQVKNTGEFNEAMKTAAKTGTALLMIKIERSTFYALLTIGGE